MTPVWPGGLPGDCWQVHDTYSECEPVEWVEGSADCDWRAAAYERAAIRPCTDLPTWTLGGRRAKHKPPVRTAWHEPAGRPRERELWYRRRAMIYQVCTESGSVYQVDTDAKLARRCAGKAPPTARVAGDWRAFASAAFAVGYPLVIAWAVDDRGPRAAPGCTPGTVTSLVVSTTPELHGGCIQSTAVARSPGAIN